MVRVITKPYPKNYFLFAIGLWTYYTYGRRKYYTEKLAEPPIIDYRLNILDLSRLFFNQLS